MDPISDAGPSNDTSSGASGWNRRVAKACASCRRDKVRCDGGRPCANCVKRGFAADQCIDGCDACRRARTRCENGKPCQRCRDINLECVDETQASSSRQEGLALSGRSARSSTDRVKLACLACRRDNKKCDELRPCTRCVARSEECVHAVRGPKLVKLRCEACRQSNKRCEDNRPCSQCIESGNECVTMPRKGRGHGTRVKAACMNCRRDKIRCDGVKPCSHCVRKGYECIPAACRACNTSGRASVCPHREKLAGERESDVETADDTHGTMQSSNQPPLSVAPVAPLPSSLPYALPPSPSQPPRFYDGWAYYAPPQSPMQQTMPSPFAGYAPMHPLPNQQHPLPHVSYYPVIDPSLESGSGQALGISAERGSQATGRRMRM